MELPQVRQLIDDLAGDIHEVFDRAAAASGKEVTDRTMTSARYLASQLALKGWRRYTI